MERDALGASHLSFAPPNAKQAVWNLLGRESKVGKQLLSLYYGGEARAPGVDAGNAGNAYSDRNLEAYRKRRAANYTPPKPCAALGVVRDRAREAVWGGRPRSRAQCVRQRCSAQAQAGAQEPGARGGAIALPAASKPGGRAALRFQGGKKTLAAIQKEATGFELPPPEPKGAPATSLCMGGSPQRSRNAGGCGP